MTLFPMRYANGAAVFDTETGGNIYRAEIPLEQAIEIMTYLDRFPIIYDCYKDNTGWMTGSCEESGVAEVIEQILQ